MIKYDLVHIGLGNIWTPVQYQGITWTNNESLPVGAYP